MSVTLSSKELEVLWESIVYLDDEIVKLWDCPKIKLIDLTSARLDRQYDGSRVSKLSWRLCRQVRRLSERGGEGSGPSPREAAFLSTLSQAPAPQPGGRRHSVVTIARVPPTLFGRNRRESIAAFPLGGATRILPSRRDSESRISGPPSNSGSTHNLQLDIMDDIAEMKARKVRIFRLFWPLYFRSSLQTEKNRV